jgi:sugar phosphate isomerase/epimerase
MSFSQYIGANLDVGHYNQTGADAVAFVKKHHDRITNLHIKDSTKPTTPGTSSDTLTPWGEGDAPIKEVLLLMKKERYPFPANIEFEYKIPPGSDAPTEVAKCYDFVKACLKG